MSCIHEYSVAAGESTDGDSVSSVRGLIIVLIILVALGVLVAAMYLVYRWRRTNQLYDDVGSSYVKIAF
jgi:heme/copper-type cytochrome/quinol oxidase subunit 2